MTEPRTPTAREWLKALEGAPSAREHTRDGLVKVEEEAAAAERKRLQQAYVHSRQTAGHKPTDRVSVAFMDELVGALLGDPT